jgi:outer membrane biosynthesis protein TonB
MKSVGKVAILLIIGILLLALQVIVSGPVGAAPAERQVGEPTNTPTATDTPTNTPVAPTNTPTNTATNTPVPPTNPPTPTDTNTPTNTPVPPTNTPTNTPTATNTPKPTKTPTKTPKPIRFEGCTTGYWKEQHHLDSWRPTDYSPTQKLEKLFDVPNQFELDNKTLKEALSFKDGSGKQGAAQMLLRAAVAALLNAAHPDVEYPRSVNDVITAVNQALTHSRDKMLTLATALDKDNNLRCPLD